MDADDTNWDQALDDWNNRRPAAHADAAKASDKAGDVEEHPAAETVRGPGEPRDRRGLGGAWLERPEDHRPADVRLPPDDELHAMIVDIRTGDPENRFPEAWTVADITQTVLDGARAPGLGADRCGIDESLFEDCSPNGGCWRIADERTNPSTSTGEPVLFGAHIDPTGTINHFWAARGYAADDPDYEIGT